jgi:hypothetical protein
MNSDDTRFDRLVDEDLNEEERRELLGRLDDEPDGWRRCALAFLQAQCWKQTFAAAPDVRDSLSVALRPAETNAGETPALRGRTQLRSPWLGRLSTLSAMAASFLVAMWLGTAAQRAWVGHSVAPSGLGTGSDYAGAGKAVRPSIGPFQPESNLVSMPGRTRMTPNPWHLVTVSAPSDGQHPRPSIEVPAVEQSNINEQWLRGLPPAIPDNVMQALARTGHQVQQRQELVPVPLQDGRRLVVPVNQVDVRFVGNGPY